MIPAAEQLKWLQLSQLAESPTAYTSVAEGQSISAMGKLLLDDHILSAALDRVPSIFNVWQKEAYISHAIGIANFDPDEAGIGELMRLLENESRVLSSPHIGCDDKASLAASVFHAGITMRNVVDKYNYQHKAMTRAVGVIMPDHIRFMQGENIRFEPPVPGQRKLATNIWIPPSSNRVQSDVMRSGKKNGSSETITTYWTPIQIRPLGSDHLRSLEVAYTTDMLVPELV